MKRQYVITLLWLSFLCFALMGTSSEMTDPMIRAFVKVFAYDADSAPFRRTLYYSIVFLGAIPAALMARRLGIRSSMLIGLCLFAGGSLSSLPATQTGTVMPFFIGLGVAALGLAFTETSALTMVLTTGKRSKTLTRMFVGKTIELFGYAIGFLMMAYFVDTRIFEDVVGENVHIDNVYFEAAQRTDLMTITVPYIWVGAMACLMAVVAAIQEINDLSPDFPRVKSNKQITRALFFDRRYVNGIVALLLYVMVVALCWFSIADQSSASLMSHNPDASASEILAYSKKFAVATLLLFFLGRIVGTILSWRRWCGGRTMLMATGGAAFILLVASAVADGELSVWLLASSAFFLAFMHPALLELSTRHMRREEVILASAGLVMGSFGGLVAWLINYRIEESALRTLIMAIAIAIVGAYGAWHIQFERKLKHQRDITLAEIRAKASNNNSDDKQDDE